MNNKNNVDGEKPPETIADPCGLSEIDGYKKEYCVSFAFYPDKEDQANSCVTFMEKHSNKVKKITRHELVNFKKGNVWRHEVHSLFDTKKQAEKARTEFNKSLMSNSL